MTPDSETKTLYEGRHLRMVQRGGWEYVERTRSTGVVVVVPITEAGEVILVEQFRPPVEARVLEFPAGLAGDDNSREGEALEEAAHRELLEETGYEAGELEFLTEGPVSAGLSTEVITLYLARGVRRIAAGGGDGSEDIQVHVVPLREIWTWLEEHRARGVMVDAKLPGGLYFAEREAGFPPPS